MASELSRDQGNRTLYPLGFSTAGRRRLGLTTSPSVLALFRKTPDKFCDGDCACRASKVGFVIGNGLTIGCDMDGNRTVVVGEKIEATISEAPATNSPCPSRSQGGSTSNTVRKSLLWKRSSRHR